MQGDDRTDGPQRHKLVSLEHFKKNTGLRLQPCLISGLRRRRRMQRARQRRLHPRLAVSQLCGRNGQMISSERDNTVLGVRSGSFFAITVQSRNQMCFARAQGSYHCGSCKTGFTGDQVKGCKPELSCGNSLTNPCDVNAQCIPERDGSITCQVAPIFFFFLLRTLYVFFTFIQSWGVSFFFPVWNRLGWKWIPLWQGHGH